MNFSKANYHVSVLDDLKKLDSIRQSWNELQSKQSDPDVDCDLEHYNALFTSIDGQSKPHVMTVSHNGEPQTIVVGRILKIRLACKIGYKTIARPKLKCLIIDGSALLGKMDDELPEVIMENLIATVNSGQADAIMLNHIKLSHPLYNLARTRPLFICRNGFPKIDPHLKMLLPQNIENFYESLSSKHKYNLQRMIKRLNVQFPGQIKIVNYTREDEVDMATAAISRISEQTYQSALGVGFTDDSVTRARLMTAARQGWLLISIMYVKDRPCSFQLAFAYKGTYFLNQMGFDSDWKKWDVGTVLFLDVLKNLCEDKGIQSIDFGFGDSSYKRSYANIVWDEASTYIFAARSYPLFVNTLYTSTAMLSRMMEKIVRKTGIYNQLKNRWRNLLQSKSATQAEQYTEVTAAEAELSSPPQVVADNLTGQLDVSIIVVNWNTKNLLNQCLKSIYEQAGNITCEIIVVDNNSSDGSAEMVASQYPQVRLIANHDNRGYAAGVNQGIKVSRGRYALVLNSDIIICEQAIAKTVRFADQHVEAAVIGPQVWKDQKEIQNTCFSNPGLVNLMLHSFGLAKLFKHNHFFGREMMLWWDRRSQRQVDVVSGMFLLVRREAIEQVGLMDESYFLYYEETDWCYRFAKSGWKMLFWPGAKIIHLDGGSHSSNQIALKSYVQKHKSMLIFFHKHYGRAICKATKILLVFDATVRYCFFMVLSNLSRLIGADSSISEQKRTGYLCALKYFLFNCEPD